MVPEELDIEYQRLKIEKWKTFLSILTPIILVYLTFVVQSNLTEKQAEFGRLEQVLKEKQRVYGVLSSDLNKIYVFVADVGDFRQYSPLEIIQKKREADRLFHTYLPYWSERTETNYRIFMSSAFETYQGSGEKAKIRTSSFQKKKAYEVDQIAWKTNWDKHFTQEVDPDYKIAYWALVESMLADTVSTEVRDLSL